MCVCVCMCVCGGEGGGGGRLQLPKGVIIVSLFYPIIMGRSTELRAGEARGRHTDRGTKN